MSASTLPLSGRHSDLAVPLRPLKLIYDHDIRLAQMPVNCSFKVLRDIVSKRFPSSKSVLIKYRDNDGDLVTITCSSELRMAESSVDSVIEKEPEPEKADPIGLLRLHIVEVTAEQEPPLLEEDEEKPVESEENKGEESQSHSSLSESVIEAGDSAIDKIEKKSRMISSQVLQKIQSARMLRWMIGCLSLLSFSALTLVLTLMLT